MTRSFRNVKIEKQMRSESKTELVNRVLNELRVAVVAILFLAAIEVSAQNVVDKTVATVSDGIRTELITYSDLRWHLAVKNGVPLSPPRSEDLNLALTELIDLRIFALEAERIPRPTPSKEEIDAEIKRILDRFPTSAEFIRRLQTVGFESITDENFQRMMRKRVAIEKFIDFRFRSFIVNTSQEETRYYNDVWAPHFRIKYPGVDVPPLEKARQVVDKLLTDSKVVSIIEAFLDDSKRRIEIVILKPV